jgi:hypothetical protein
VLFFCGAGRTRTYMPVRDRFYRPASQPIAQRHHFFCTSGRTRTDTPFDTVSKTAVYTIPPPRYFFADTVGFEPTMWLPSQVNSLMLSASKRRVNFCMSSHTARLFVSFYLVSKWSTYLHNRLTITSINEWTRTTFAVGRGFEPLQGATRHP